MMAAMLTVGMGRHDRLGTHCPRLGRPSLQVRIAVTRRFRLGGGPLRREAQGMGPPARELDSGIGPIESGQLPGLQKSTALE